MGACASAKSSTQSVASRGIGAVGAGARPSEPLSRDQAEKILQNLLESYGSIQTYIESLRSNAFSRLFKNLDKTTTDSLSLNEADVAGMESLAKDFVSFKQFKKINRYKYQLVISEFISSIRECLLKIKRIDANNTQNLEALNEFHVSHASSLPKKFLGSVQTLYSLIMKVAIYLESDQHADSSLSCNYFTLELTSINSKRLSAYQIPLPHSRTIQPSTASLKSIKDEETPSQ